MAIPNVQGIGTATASASAATTPAWPSHVAGDWGYLVVASSAEACVLTDAQGFVEMSSSPKEIGVTGSATSLRLTLFTCKATSGSMTAPTVPDTGAATMAWIFTVRGADGTTPIHIQQGSTQSTGTTFSNPTLTTTVADCLIIRITGNTSDTTTAQTTWTANGDLANEVTQFDENTSVGNGVGFSMRSGEKAVAGVIAATTGTLLTSSVKVHYALAIVASTTTDHALAGTFAGDGALAADCVAGRTLAGTYAGAGALSADCVAGRALAGTFAGAGDFTADCVAGRALAGSADGLGDLMGACSAGRALEGALAGAGGCAAALLADRTLAGSVDGAGAASATLLRATTFAGSIPGLGALTGLIGTSLGLYGAISATSALESTGELFVLPLGVGMSNRLPAIVRFASGLYVVTRRGPGTWTDGIHVPDPSPEFVSMVASVQPVTGREFSALPEGRRADEVRVVYTATPLRVTDEDGAADVIAIDGETWEVYKIETWFAWGVTHYRAMVSRMEVP